MALANGRVIILSSESEGEDDDFESSEDEDDEFDGEDFDIGAAHRHLAQRYARARNTPEALARKERRRNEERANLFSTRNEVFRFRTPLTSLNENEGRTLLSTNDPAKRIDIRTIPSSYHTDSTSFSIHVPSLLISKTDRKLFVASCQVKYANDSWATTTAVNLGMDLIALVNSVPGVSLIQSDYCTSSYHCMENPSDLYTMQLLPEQLPLLTPQIPQSLPKIVLFVVHGGLHWNLMAWFSTTGSICYYDSKGTMNYSTAEAIVKHFNSSKVSDKSQSYFTTFKPSSTEIHMFPPLFSWDPKLVPPITIVPVPQQKNNSVCGFYSTAMAQLITSRALAGNYYPPTSDEIAKSLSFKYSMLLFTSYSQWNTILRLVYIQYFIYPLTRNVDKIINNIPFNNLFQGVEQFLPISRDDLRPFHHDTQVQLQPDEEFPLVNPHVILYTFLRSNLAEFNPTKYPHNSRFKVTSGTTEQAIVTMNEFQRNLSTTNPDHIGIHFVQFKTQGFYALLVSTITDNIIYDFTGKLNTTFSNDVSLLPLAQHIDKIICPKKSVITSLFTSKSSSLSTAMASFLLARLIVETGYHPHNLQFLNSFRVSAFSNLAQLLAQNLLRDVSLLQFPCYDMVSVDFCYVGSLRINGESSVSSGSSVKFLHPVNLLEIAHFRDDIMTDGIDLPQILCNVGKETFELKETWQILNCIDNPNLSQRVKVVNVRPLSPVWQTLETNNFGVSFFSPLIIPRLPKSKLFLTFRSNQFGFDYTTIEQWKAEYFALSSSYNQGFEEQREFQLFTRITTICSTQSGSEGTKSIISLLFSIPHTFCGTLLNIYQQHKHSPPYCCAFLGDMDFLVPLLETYFLKPLFFICSSPTKAFDFIRKNIIFFPLRLTTSSVQRPAVNLPSSNSVVSFFDITRREVVEGVTRLRLPWAEFFEATTEAFRDTRVHPGKIQHKYFNHTTMMLDVIIPLPSKFPASANNDEKLRILVYQQRNLTLIIDYFVSIMKHHLLHSYKHCKSHLPRETFHIQAPPVPPSIQHLIITPHSETVEIEGNDLISVLVHDLKILSLRSQKKRNHTCISIDPKLSPDHCVLCLIFGLD